MKIAYIGFGHIDGALPLLRNLGEGRGHEIDYYILLSATAPLESVLDLRPHNLSHKIFSFEESALFLPEWMTQYLRSRVRVSVGIYPNYKLYLPSSHFWFRSFCRMLSLQSYDLIHVSGVSTFMFHLLGYSPLRRVPKVITIHDLTPHTGEDSWSRRLINPQKRVISHYTTILHNQIDLCRVAAGSRVYFVPFGVMDFFPMIEAAEVPNSDILFFGRISPYKGIPDLLAAFGMLRSENPSLRLCIAGPGDLNTENVELNDGIHLINRYVTVEELSGLIRNTRVVVCPYLDATQSGVLATAHAFGRATVVTNVGGFNDVITDGVNGISVSPSSPLALAQGIEALLDDQFRQKIEKNIVSFYQRGRFSWPNIATEYESIYRGLLCGN